MAPLKKYSIGFRYYDDPFTYELEFDAEDVVHVINQTIDAALDEGKHLDLVEWVIAKGDVDNG
tara:strand:- start:270 stop:458 length:189 start_codon:yes stop_codon:yes gene_type:complete